MADLGSARGLISIDFDGSGVAAATSAVTGFDQKSSGIGQKAALGFGLLGAAAGLAGKSVIGAFAGFEQAIANVNSLGGEAIPNLNQSLFEMSEATNQGPTQLAEGLYNVVSSGFAGADALTVLEASAIAASAGMTTTEVAGRAIAGAINAYGDDAKDATDYSDILFQTVNQGVLTFEELANNMSQTTPVAAALGVQMNELGAAYASLTLQTFSATGAETGIAAIMRSVVSPTEELKAATLDYTNGLTDNTEQWLNSIPEGERFAALLGLIDKESGGTLTGIRALTGTQEAATATQALLNETSKGYVGQLDQMNAALEKGGVTQAAFEEQTNTVSASFKALKNAVQIALIQIGAELAPAIRTGTAALLSLVQAFGSLPDSVKTAVAIFVGLAAVLAAVGVAVAIAIPVLAALGVVAAAIGAPFLLAALAVGLLAAAFGGPILDAAGELFDYLKQVVETQSTFNDALDKLPESIQPAAEALGRLVDAFADLYRAFQADGLSGLIAALPGELQQMAQALADVFIDVTVSIGNWLLGQVADFGGFLQDVITGQGSGAGADLHDVVVNIGSWARGTIASIADWVQGLFSGGATSDGEGGVSGGGGVTLNGVLVNIGSWARGTIADLWSAIKNFAIGGDSGANSPGFEGDSGGFSGGNGITLGEIAVSIGSWLVSEAESLAEATTQKVLELWNAAKSVPAALGGWAIKAGAWLISEGESLAAAALTKILELWNAAKSAAVTLGGYAIKAGAWLVSEGEPLAAAVVQKVLELWNAAKSVPAALGGYAIKAGAWLISEGDTLAVAVTQKVLELWNAAKAIPAALGGYAIKAGAWLISEGDTLAVAVTQKVLELWNAAKATAVALGGYAIKAGAWLITEGDALKDAAGTKVLELWNAFAAAGKDLSGYAVRIGAWVVTATEDLYTAIARFVTGGGGSGFNGSPGTPGQGGSIVPLGVVAAAIGAWAISAGKDFGVAVKEFIADPTVTLNSIKVNIPGFDIGDISAKLSTFISSIKNSIQTAVNGLGTGDVFDFATFTSGIGASVRTAIDNAVTAIGKFLGEGLTVDNLKKAVDVYAKAESMFLGALAFIAAGLAGAIYGFAFGEQVDFGQIATKIGDGVKEAFDDISGVVGDVTAAASAFLGKIWDAITSVFSGGGGGGFNGSPGTPGQGASGLQLSGLTESINSAINAALAAVASSIPGLTTVISAVQSVITKTQEAINKLKELGGGGGAGGLTDTDNPATNPNDVPAPAGKGYSSLLLDVGKKSPFDSLIASATAAAAELETAMGGIVLVVQSGMASISSALSGTALAGDGGGTPGSLSPGGAGGGILSPFIAQFTAAVPLITAAMTSVASTVALGMTTITTALSGTGGQFNGSPGTPGQAGGAGGGGILAPLIAEFTAAVPLVTTAMAAVAAAVSTGMATITAALSGGGGFNGAPGVPGQGGGGGAGLLAPFIAQFTAAGALITVAMTTMSAAVTTGMTAMATAVTTSGPKITGALTSAFVVALAAVRAQAALFGPIGTQIVTSITSAITASAARISGALTSAVIIALSAGRASAEAANQIGTIIVDRASSAVSGGSGRLSGAVTSMVNVAVSAGRSSAEAANQIGSIIVDRASSAVSGSGALSGAVTSAVIVAISAGVGAAAGAEAIGAAISTGMAAGISSAPLVGAMVGAVNEALAAGKAAAGIASPSKRAIDEIGKPLAEGIALGITAATPNAQSAMRDTIDSLFTQRYGPALSLGAPVAPALASRGGSSTTVNHGDTTGDTYVLNIDGTQVSGNARAQQALRDLVGSLGAAVDTTYAGVNR